MSSTMISKSVSHRIMYAPNCWVLLYCWLLEKTYGFCSISTVHLSERKPRIIITPNDHYGVSNHRTLECLCLFNCLLKLSNEPYYWLVCVCVCVCVCGGGGGGGDVGIRGGGEEEVWLGDWGGADCSHSKRSSIAGNVSMSRRHHTVSP